MGGKGGEFWGSCPPETSHLESGRKERSQCPLLPDWSWQEKNLGVLVEKNRHSQVLPMKNGKFLESPGWTHLENTFKVVFTL